MFEDSLFESQVRAASPRSRWTAAVSLTVQAAAASLLVLVPLLRTELLPERRNALTITVPLPLPLPVPPPPPPHTVAQRASSAMASVVPLIGRMLVAPRIVPQRIDTSPEPTNVGATPLQMGSPTVPTGLWDVIGGPAPAVRVAPVDAKKVGPVHVSAGVIAGLLLAPIRPVYPPIAKAAHVEGTVVVEAVISKDGTIESLQVASGPAMLQSAALNAIREARYQPFRLNGEATEVRTTITVNFKMGN